MCVIVDDDDLHAELAMIDENLCRAELSPSDRAKQTARRKAIYLELHPETALGENQHTRVGQLVQPNFAVATAAVTGTDARTVRRDAERGEKVIPEVMGMIHGTKLDTGTYLDKLKGLRPNEQVTAAKRDLAYSRQQDRDRAGGGLQRRIVPKTPEPKVNFDAVIGWINVIESIPVGDLIGAAGRERAVLGQRASGLIDYLQLVLEGLGK